MESIKSETIRHTIYYDDYSMRSNKVSSEDETKNDIDKLIKDSDLNILDDTIIISEDETIKKSI